MHSNPSALENINTVNLLINSWVFWMVITKLRQTSQRILMKSTLQSHWILMLLVVKVTWWMVELGALEWATGIAKHRQNIFVWTKFPVFKLSDKWCDHNLGNPKFDYSFISTSIHWYCKWIYFSWNNVQKR